MFRALITAALVNFVFTASSHAESAACGNAKTRLGEIEGRIEVVLSQWKTTGGWLNALDIWWNDYPGKIDRLREERTVAQAVVRRTCG